MNAFFLFELVSAINKDTNNQPNTRDNSQQVLDLFQLEGTSVRSELNTLPPIAELHLLEGSKLALHYLVNQDSRSADLVLQALIAKHTTPCDWEANYLDLLEESLKRLSLGISIETFESTLEEISWKDLPEAVLGHSLFLTGFVYLQEALLSNQKKCKLWFEQLTQNSAHKELGLMAYFFLFEYHLRGTEASSLQNLHTLCNQLENLAATSPGEDHVLQLLNFRNELKTLRDDPAQIFDILNRSAQKITGNNSLSEINRLCFLFLLFKDIQPILWKAMPGRRATLAKELIHIQETLKLHEQPINANTCMSLSLLALTIPLKLYLDKPVHALEEVTKLFDLLKEERRWKLMVQLTEFLNPIMANAQMSDPMIRLLFQHLDTLLANASSICTETAINLIGQVGWLYKYELTKPGVSPLISEIPELIQRHEQLLEQLDLSLDELGASGFEHYQTTLIILKEISQYHIRASFQIYVLQIRMLGLSCKVKQDRIGYEISQSMLHALYNPSNPLSFIQGKWDEFKDVPNDFRNKVINHSISIFKGDLPAAAEHLPYSYRNIRNYISLNEVDRLGDFMHEKKTSNRNLEEGLRLLFHDLYLKGHIFEALFDLPAYLIQKSGIGFTPKEMEQHLNVKPSTIKKYIRIMTEAGMLESIKSEASKSIYRIHVENIMRRYGLEVSKSPKTSGSHA